MSEEETTPEVQFAVTIVKQADGNIALAQAPGLPEATGLDQVYEAICIVKRNLESQQTVGAFMAALEGMQQAATQQAAAAAGRTESGLIVPR